MGLTATRIETCSVVSRQHACERLGVGMRRLRQLVAAGRLAVAGSGHVARITEQSLNREIIRRATRKSLRSKGRNLSDLVDIFPDFSDPHLAGKTESRHNVDIDMRLCFHQQRVASESAHGLLSQARVATMLGISPSTLRAAVTSGQVRSIVIGKRKRIPAEVVRELASGRLKEST